MFPSFFAPIIPSDFFLVVAGYVEFVASVAVDVSNLGVPHPAELSSEICLPKAIPLSVGMPELNDRLGAAQRKKPFRSIRHCFVENVALGIFERSVVPFVAVAGKNTNAPGNC